MPAVRAAQLASGAIAGDANGQNSAPIELNALADQTHILTACDLFLLPSGVTPPLNFTGLGCVPLVTHTDGTMVSASKPANVGETMTAWAVGLGQTNPAASTGQPASAAPTVQTFSLDFNYAVNALATKPFTGRPVVKPPQPLFAGLAPGYPGLYQINFVVPPEPPNGTPRCALLPVAFGLGSSVPQSNLTVSFGGAFSFDGAGICVATRIPID